MFSANVQENKTFFVFLPMDLLKEYELEVSLNPIVLEFWDVGITISEIHKEENAKVAENTGDLVVPAGTTISLKFNTRANLIFFLHSATLPSV